MSPSALPSSDLIHEMRSEPVSFLYVKNLETYKTEKPFQIFHTITPDENDKRKTNVEKQNTLLKFIGS